MKIKSIIALLSTTFLFLVSSCNENIKDYYYSLEDLKTPKLFVYTCKEDSTRTQYWKMSANIDSNFLITEAFNSSFEQFEYFKEKFDTTGSKLVEYTMINEGDRTFTTPLTRDVFVWNPKTKYDYSVNYPNNDDQILFRKTRSLNGKEKIEIMGKKIEALQFKGVYHYKSEQYKDSMEYWQHSYYAKGIGFVKYERQLNNGKIISLELTDILSEENWNKLK
jgi:hypothetical protein